MRDFELHIHKRNDMNKTDFNDTKRNTAPPPTLNCSLLSPCDRAQYMNDAFFVMVFETAVVRNI